MKYIGITRTYGFRLVPHQNHARVGMLKCPYCDSLDVAVEAVWPQGGSGPRVNNAVCERCGHVGEGTVSHPSDWGVTWGDDYDLRRSIASE